MSVIISLANKCERWKRELEARDALAAGAQSAETNEDLAQSEGRQSGGESRNAQSTPLEKNEEKRRGV